MLRLSIMLVCLLALFPELATARFAGPPETWQKLATVRDLADIRQSGELRVLINQSRNSSGAVKGQAIGSEYVRLHAFIDYLNREPRKGQAITLKLIPKAKDQLLGALERGEGDMVAPGELLDNGNASHIVASRPVLVSVPMVLVTRKGSRTYRNPAQLSGHTLVLPPGSVAGAELAQLNRQLEQKKRSPVSIEWVDPSLAVEDVLDMVQAGIYPATVVEKHIAERWAMVMPKLQLEPDVHLGEPGDMHWFFLSDADKLQASANSFLTSYRAPADLDAAFGRVYRNLYKVHYPLDSTGRQRLEKVRPTLQRYANKHAMDWLGLAALAFKESTLNPEARGSSGGVGLMQVTPNTADSVGVKNISRLDNNVQASARYLDQIQHKFFASPRLNERERMAFTLAAYNLGPQRVQALRSEARRRGLNPDQWFFQVERIAMERVGMGVVSYVNSVNKYFLAYARERYRLEFNQVSAKY